MSRALYRQPCPLLHLHTQAAFILKMNSPIRALPKAYFMNHCRFTEQWRKRPSRFAYGDAATTIV